ncbi:FAR1 domain-containing protein/SWIM domain-containing protein/MULE domain-containing protein [Cephalotus follicularis]|uniref:Protein FAR1-RELATED SEQUENCE n=1 Tax=Cephalotus follicularis TaxID=3775 RepID=A0A1Q3CDN1_CEPFO|nr:FAR1 domain-containing protein/SWIM domain-containing protein/MULE domain-containing protein [Cephalotus follicularis]
MYAKHREIHCFFSSIKISLSLESGISVCVQAQCRICKDLELSSHEQKLDTGSDKDADIMDSADALHVEEEDETSPTTSEHVEEDCEPNVNESVTSDVVQVDVKPVGGNAVINGAFCEPQNGLEFETKEDAYSFYREYARSVGFGITIKASRRSKKSGKFIDVKIACSRFGSKRESNTTVGPRSCIKTNCKAGMHMKRRQDGKWIIYSVIKEHNHEICPDDIYHAIRGRYKQSGVVTCQKKSLQLALDEGDVLQMLDLFMCMQDEYPNFFYAIDFDNEKQVRSVFWVDAKGRHDYNNFCDVVFFDTFYVRNKYKVPYAPFIGINHHFQFILLGCALIGEETTSALVWLMRTWLKAVGSQAPRVIITDQDNFLKEAVTDVFPHTRHCFCLWHILNKIPESLGCMIDQPDYFMGKFNKCIYQSWTEEQFEKRWWKMVDKFELKDNKWVQSLYEDRRKWAPTYMQGMCLAGMSTSERSGSINSFFDKYISREDTFKEFIKQYRAFTQDRNELEAKAEFEARNKQPALRSLSALEKQLSFVYTDAVFKKFQVEILGVVSCHLQKESEDEATVIFRVDDFAEHQNFFVAWKEAESEICCLCRSFEYRGFLCKHAILVLQMSGVSDIPSCYILKRWTKDAKIGQNSSQTSSKHHYRVQRFNDLCKHAIKLGEEGSLSQEAYNIAVQALEEALEHCVDSNNSGRAILEPNILAVRSFPNDDEQNHGNRVSKSSKKKMYKKRKACSEQEGTTIRSQDNLQQMEQMNSRAHNIGNCYVPQHDMHGTEIGNRTQTIDGYYGSQQSMLGVAQLESISPLRDAYFSDQPNHPRAHGAGVVLGQLHSVPMRVNHYGTQQSIQGVLGFTGPTILGCFDIPDSLQYMEQSVASTQYQDTASKLCDKRLSE